MLEVEGGTPRVVPADPAPRGRPRHRERVSAARAHAPPGAVRPHLASPIPTPTRPSRYSRSFVSTSNGWYAQSHPDEDFAETFAVWLTPGHQLARALRGVAGAAQARVRGQGRCAGLRGKPQSVKTRRTQDALHTIRRTLRRHYQRRRAHYGVVHRDAYDRDLRACSRRRLPTRPPPASRPRCSSRASAARVRRRVQRWTGEYLYAIDRMLEDIIERCRTLDLRAQQVRGRDRAAVHRVRHGASGCAAAPARATGCRCEEGGGGRPQAARAGALPHDLVPPEDRDREGGAAAEWKTEYDVVRALREPGPRGAAARASADELGAIRNAVEEFKPAHRLQPARGLRRRGDLGPERRRLPGAAEDPLHRLQLARAAARPATRRSPRSCSRYHRVPVADFAVFPARAHGAPARSGSPSR